MDKVFLITEAWDYEGTKVMGIFSTAAKAEKFLKVQGFIKISGSAKRGSSLRSKWKRAWEPALELSKIYVESVDLDAGVI